MLDEHHIAGDAIALTGNCGIMMKTFLMVGFCGDVATMLNLLCMPCTSAANCSVSSKECFRAFRYLLPPHIIDIMQEMGRVDCAHNAKPGDHQYEIFLSFNVVMNLFLHIFQKNSEKVRVHEMEQVFVDSSQ